MIKKLDSIDEFMEPKDKKASKKENKEGKISFFTPNIAVLGIGGSGTNAINNLMNMNLTNVKFMVANTDIKSLNNSPCPNKIRLGIDLTKGLGAGSNPEIGFKAAKNSEEEIKRALEGVDLLFLIAGMGGGTGTGASSVIANIAQELNILTLGFVTKPFAFEGKQRMILAETGLKELEKYIDSIIIMSNQNLFKVVKEDTSMLEAFRVTDNIIFSGIKAISDLIVANGMVNLDFNDIKFIIKNGGRAIVTSAEVSGGDKVHKLTETILHNPLIDDDISIVNAKNILISIAGGVNMTLFEVDKIINSLRSKANKSNYINFGAIFDKDMSEKVRVSVIATGIFDNLNLDNQEDISSTQESASNNMNYHVTNSEPLAKSNSNSNSSQELLKQSMVEKRNNVTSDKNPFNTYSNNEHYSPTTNFSDQYKQESEVKPIPKKDSLFNFIEKAEVKERTDSTYNKVDSNCEENLNKNHDKNKNLKNFFDIPPFLKNKNK